MTGLDRRTSQKLVRGNAQIDARFDLHGLTKENARISLLNFLVRCRQDGYQTVLVITGKGKTSIARHTLHSYDHFDMPEHEGILKRAFPIWLSEPEFYKHVTGYQPAHPKHGGGGAFYVRLRRPGR
jgi:DNA-nicking Smr family endonuclease